MINRRLIFSGLFDALAKAIVNIGSQFGVIIRYSLQAVVLIVYQGFGAGCFGVAGIVIFKAYGVLTWSNLLDQTLNIE